MKTKIYHQPTGFTINQSIEGEPIEHKIERITNNKEPITEGAPIIFTQRRDGVQPAYNIRSDRFEIATEAMDKVTKSNLAKREQKAGKIIKMDTDTTNKIGGAEPIQGE